MTSRSDGVQVGLKWLIRWCSVHTLLQPFWIQRQKKCRQEKGSSESRAGGPHVQHVSWTCLPPHFTFPSCLVLCQQMLNSEHMLCIVIGCFLSACTHERHMSPQNSFFTAKTEHVVPVLLEASTLLTWRGLGFELTCKGQNMLCIYTRASH